MINYLECCKDNNITIDRVDIFSNYVLVYSFDDVYLIKNNKIDISHLFKYFKNIDFDGYIYPIIVNRNYELYKYYLDCSLDNHEKANALVKILSDLHTKSYTYIDYSDKKKEYIYTLYKEKIDSCFSYYLNLQDSIEEMNIIMPNYYLLLNNISKFYKLLKYSKYYLDKFYESSNNHYREAMIVFNLSLSNFCFSDKKFFIDWDNSKKDLIIFDFVNFYKENYNIVDVVGLFEYYNSKVKFSDDELNLFFTIISIPSIIDFTSYNFINTYKVRENINYVDITLKFISEKYKENKE